MSESKTSPTALRWGVALAAGLMALGLASGPALADGWRHDGHDGPHPHYRHEREWHRHYVPPPVIYAPPPAVYYAPPPVVYAPPSGINIILPIRIH